MSSDERAARDLLLGWPDGRERELGIEPENWLEEAAVDRGAVLTPSEVVVPDDPRPNDPPPKPA